jgi:hypothetical protein
MACKNTFHGFPAMWPKISFCFVLYMLPFRLHKLHKPIKTRNWCFVLCMNSTLTLWRNMTFTITFVITFIPYHNVFDLSSTFVQYIIMFISPLLYNLHQSRQMGLICCRVRRIFLSQVHCSLYLNYLVIFYVIYNILNT